MDTIYRRVAEYIFDGDMIEAEYLIEKYDLDPFIIDQAMVFITSPIDLSMYE